MKIDFIFRSYLSAFLVGIALIGVEATAQSRAVPLLDAPSDARSAAMGGVTLMSTDRTYLYVNPASLFSDDTKVSVTLSGLLYPRLKTGRGRLKDATFSAGWQFADKHAVFAGFRYQGGVSHTVVSGQYGQAKDQEYNPFDWTADFGYAYSIDNRFSAFATASFIQSYTGRPAYAGAFSLGANYRTPLSMNLAQPTLLNVAARIANFGTPLAYSTDEKYYLPTKAELTADLSMPFSPDHRVTTVVSGQYGFMPIGSSLIVGSVGAEYTVYDIVSMRAGLRIGNRYTNYWTCGIGVQYMGAKIDFAYMGGLKDRYTNRLALTLSYNY